MRQCLARETLGSAHWTPIVVLDDGVAFYPNRAACHAAVNRSAGCGEAHFRDDLCAAQTCTGCLPSKKTECLEATRTYGPCKPMVSAIAAKCPLETKSEDLCKGSLLSNVRLLCGPAL